MPQSLPRGRILFSPPKERQFRPPPISSPLYLSDTHTPARAYSSYLTVATSSSTYHSTRTTATTSARSLPRSTLPWLRRNRRGSTTEAAIAGSTPRHGSTPPDHFRSWTSSPPHHTVGRHQGPHFFNVTATGAILIRRFFVKRARDGLIVFSHLVCSSLFSQSA